MLARARHAAGRIGEQLQASECDRMAATDAFAKGVLVDATQRRLHFGEQFAFAFDDLDIRIDLAVGGIGQVNRGIGKIARGIDLLTNGIRYVFDIAEQPIPQLAKLFAELLDLFGRKRIVARHAPDLRMLGEIDGLNAVFCLQAPIRANPAPPDCSCSPTPFAVTHAHT